MIHPLRMFLCTLTTLTALLVPLAAAQVPITLTGTVTYRSGGVLPGTTVEASDGNRLVATMTEPDGRYRLGPAVRGGLSRDRKPRWVCDGVGGSRGVCRCHS